MSKVTLKIGDKFSNRAGIEEFITGFANNQIKTTRGSWDLRVWDYYYVNGVKYAKKDIIVPTVEEFEPITKDNIAEVLEYNGVKDAFSIDNNARSIVIGSGAPEWCSVNFKNPNWLQIIEAHLDKKLKPLPKKTNPFDAVKIGQWVRYVGEDAFETTKNKWYQRIPSNCFAYKTDDGSIVHTTEYEEWDLTDIRDYNPDEEITLKVGDKIKFNYLDVDIMEIDSFSFIYSKIRYKNTNLTTSFGSINDGHIFSVNGRQGKYVIPPFDFERTLMDAGFTRHFDGDPQETDNLYFYGNKHMLICYDSELKKYYHQGKEIKPTPENATHIINAAKILKKLEI